MQAFERIQRTHSDLIWRAASKQT